MKPTWKPGALLAAAMLTGWNVPAMAQNTGSATAGASNTSTKTAAADTKFAHEAAIGGMMEVELGKIAVQKASDSKVKEFGQRMIDDHSKAGDELKGIAAKQNITLSSELDAKHKAMVDKYSNMSGAAFDRAYIRDMVKDHQEDVAEFQKEANSGSNPDLKNWAGSTLPTLQEHLRMAKEAENTISRSKSAK